MAASIRIRAKLSDGITEVKALMRHPMETGQRKDSRGQTIPAHYITEVSATVGERVVMRSFWGAAVSQNPFLGFRFSGAKAGDAVEVKWLDNKGESGSGTAKIA